MKIIFMGTPEFAVPCLDILLKNNYDVAGVVTAPDKVAGRGQKLNESAVKQFAREHKLNILQPTNLKDPSFEETLKNLNADLQIVVAFRMLPEKIWNMPPLGTFNVHASLLPQFRGAAPINRAIMAGAKETGVSTFKLQHEIDTGNILLQRKVKIEDEENVGSLYLKLMQAGAELLLETVQMIELNLKKGTALKFTVQDEKLVSHAPKIFKDDCRINWNNKMQDIHNQIRGLSPIPGAFTELNNTDKKISVKIFRSATEKSDDGITNGLLYTDNKTFIKIKCEGGFINVLEIQAEGKKRMSSEEFLRGFRLNTGAFCQ